MQEREGETINRKSLPWDVRSCVVCEGPIWIVTAESCVYDRWNNLSNNDTTSGVLWRCASVWLCSPSPSLSCSFNVFMCSVYFGKSVFVCACMHICTHAYHAHTCGNKEAFSIVNPPSIYLAIHAYIQKLQVLLQNDPLRS